MTCFTNVTTASATRGILHLSDVIMRAMASQITSVSIVYSNISSGANQRKHYSSASLTCVRGIHRWPTNSPHKGPVTRNKCPFHDIIRSISAKPCAWFSWVCLSIVITSVKCELVQLNNPNSRLLHWCWGTAEGYGLNRRTRNHNTESGEKCVQGHSMHCRYGTKDVESFDRGKTKVCTIKCNS